MEAYFRRYKKSDLEEVMSMKLRKADVDEITALYGPSTCISREIERSIHLSDRTYVIIDSEDSKIIAVFGVGYGGFLVGVPWFLATDEVKKHRGMFVKHAKEVLKILSKDYTILTNWVSSENPEAIKLLEWLGFTIHKEDVRSFDRPTGFYRFQKVGGKPCVHQQISLP